MVCQNFEDSLDRYDELKNEERAVVEAHLSGCAVCRDFLAALMQLDLSLTQEYSSITPTPLFQGRVRSKVRAERVSFLPEVFDFIGWTSVVLICLSVVWRTVDVPRLVSKMSLVPLPLVAIGIALTLMVLVGIGLKVYSDLET